MWYPVSRRWGGEGCVIITIALFSIATHNQNDLSILLCNSSLEHFFGIIILFNRKHPTSRTCTIFVIIALYLLGWCLTECVASDFYHHYSTSYILCIWRVCIFPETIEPCSTFHSISPSPLPLTHCCLFNSLLLSINLTAVHHVSVSLLHIH